MKDDQKYIIFLTGGPELCPNCQKDFEHFYTILT